MLKRERQAYILEQLSKQNRVLSTDLSQSIKVSDDTIRRDLQELAAAKKLVKVHGGALSSSFNKKLQYPFSSHSIKQRQIIANKAVSLLKNGMFVLTGGNSTVIEFARCLPGDLRATFISGSIPALYEYMNYPGIEVIVIGDKLSRYSKQTTGIDAITHIKQLHADLCFLGINAFDPLYGVTDDDWDLVQVKKAMMQSSQQTACLCLSKDLDRILPIQICETNKINFLITELTVMDPQLLPFAELGITIL